jgi:hypothetical protein
LRVSIPAELQRHPTVLFGSALLACLFGAGTLFDAMAQPEPAQVPCAQGFEMQYAPTGAAARQGAVHDDKEPRRCR